MVRRVVPGLAVAGLCGAFARAAPTLIVEELGSGLAAGQFQPGLGYDFGIYVENLDDALTNNPQIGGSGLVGYIFTFFQNLNNDLSPRDNSDLSGITFTSFNAELLFGFPLTGPDNDLSPTKPPTEAADGGTSTLLTTVPPSIGNAKTLLATFSIDIAEYGDATNTFLYIAANARGRFPWAGGPGDGNYDPDVDGGVLFVQSETDVGVLNAPVNNIAFGGPNVESSGVPLIPEPATIALMLAACGGGLVSRRRRS